MHLLNGIYICTHIIILFIYFVLGSNKRFTHTFLKSLYLDYHSLTYITTNFEIPETIIIIIIIYEA